MKNATATLTELDYALNVAHTEIDTTNARAELAQLRASIDALNTALRYEEFWHREYRQKYYSLHDPIEKLMADNDALTAQNADQARRLSEALHGMIDGWRDYANGHYCRTYNPGMTQGLNCAADALEAYVTEFDTIEYTAPHAPALQAEQEKK